MARTPLRSASAAAAGFGLSLLLLITASALLSGSLELPARQGGVQFLDRHGVVFAERPGPERGFGMWRDQHSSHVVLATMAAEDNAVMATSV